MNKKITLLTVKIPIWLLILMLVASGAGAGAAVSIAAIGGKMQLAAGQAILIDNTQFDEEDLSDHAKRRFVAVSRDRTAFTAGAELATGEELVIDVPLINLSDRDLTVELVMEAPPPLSTWVESFWTTETIGFSRADGTITEDWAIPSPPPFTQSWEQSADTTETNAPPPGLSGSVTSRIQDLVSTTSAPAGTPSIAAQSVDSTATTTRPPGAVDSRSGTWYTGQFLVDVDADGTKEEVYFVLADNLVSGTYNTMDLSTDDTTFGETLGGLLNNGMTGPQDDERITASTAVRLGPFYTSTVAFDSNPAADTDDARITAKTWFIATITDTDLDGEGAADDTFYSVLTDNDSDGLYEKLDLSIGDTVFGEGNLGDLIIDFTPGDPVTGNTDDESLTAALDTSSGTFDVKLGTYTFTFSFDTTPGGGL